ncbi:indole-3-glycerol phosphate synthase (IGPS) / N-(5'-phospho-ribosyl)anthranilate isomerase (PRAI) [Buchnera aphidicola (Cinara tujafilina)]|uniref:N-(5'-phosphoribosyl)anthranilate isomerase n=1 Tax=Buchnera aphidicola (Cinara tujafilina) TaxID=261317 RepID=F7WZA8_9GAMM|nr:bifunctional indole-3-glycerol-phosphate synthase TrpC/phosphoribosylanthranilate isomerase TrpF [Buchnera aphidicola]AEH39767.1 indole-3-glycerol phosphate synthase (IGPS) / N-(5'-phospho-ribosyl)anthranilate isomerase (PRAI) [Buchnera aphidicola (Cinara tujafilina)]
MNSNTLNNILHYKNEWIKLHKLKKPLESFYSNIKNQKFLKRNTKNNPAFILECKKASPSIGLLRTKFNIPKIIQVYKKYASAISIVTENKFFKGKFKYLKQASQCTNKPLLCKDFFIDPYQIYYARYYQADAILLMMSILSNSQYVIMSNVAKKMNIDIVTEVHNISELHRALSLNADIIGINNRNLKNLSIDLKTTCRIAPLVPSDRIVISESGINKYKQIRMLSRYVNGFLIGSHLMKSNSLKKTVCSMIYGKNKVCGLTRVEDAFIVKKSGSIYGGLFFYKSPRYIKLRDCKKITSQVKLKYVGVFYNSCMKYILSRVIKLSLAVVQLHGQENQDYIKKLRSLLPKNVKIWKALPVFNNFPIERYNYINCYLIDHKNGGTGKNLIGILLKKNNVSKMMLAGGLKLNNIFQASTLGFCGLDLNSGLEISPGIKDSKKIRHAFNIIKNFPAQYILKN